MRISLKIVIGVVSTLLVAVLAVTAIGYHLVTKSFPKTSGTIKVAGLENEVKIFRDEYGIPHINAQNEHDAFFAIGYTHAQERLWQMELERRVGMGRLSEILGAPALPIDKMFRTLGLWQYVHKISPTLDDDTRKTLQAYTDGVNAYIADNKGRYPIEFDMLQFEPEPWTIEHSLLLSRLMAWEMNFSRWMDLLLGELVQRFGEEKAKELFPIWQNNAPYIVASQRSAEPIVPVDDHAAKTKSTHSKKHKHKGSISDLKPFFDAERTYRNLLDIKSFESGSNAWVVSGAKSQTGKPILANDPHLLLMSPGRWYELHVTAPNLDVAGMTIAGMPFVILGRNQHIAWGVTNAMLDDDDFYMEDVDSLQHPTRYRYNGEWKPIEESVDTIFVKNGSPVLLSIYKTHRGPIVNKMEPGAQFATSLVSMRWTGFEISNEAGAFYKIDKATNWEDFKNALRQYAAPAQNFVYADVDGNIGYYTGGKLPIRKTVNGATLPHSGETNEYDWQGYVPFEQMPHTFNPPNGFIATANNKIVDDSYPYHISNHWEPPYRAMRINEALNEQSKFSIEDMQHLQNDYFSTHAREVVPYILHAFDSVTVTNPDVKIALEYFRTWNFEMRKEDVTATLFNVTFTKLIDNTFHNKMGDPLFTLFDTISSTPIIVTTQLLKNNNSTWFDDPRTPNIETRDDILRKSVYDAVAELQLRLGGKVKEWQWGRLHTITFDHVFGQNSLLKSFFSVGPYEVGGGHSTVNVGQFFFNSSYESTVGASMRQIFNLADINDTRVVMPPGQSGHVFSPHYKDQTMLWLNGVYRTRPMDQSVIQATCSHILILKPVK